MHEQLLAQAVASHPSPLLFATISGAHLYGFPSPDSDYDIRGAHVMALEDVVRLKPPSETLDETTVVDDVVLDVVSHDIHKYFSLMLKRNGYVLEQICSPLVIHSTPEFEELRALVPACITHHHVHHYRGFSQNQWRLFDKDRRVKPLLYTYRVLLTGIHLMQSGEVEANLLTLNERFGLPYIADLVALKREGPENTVIEGADLDFHRAEFDRLSALLVQAHEASSLPEAPSARDALDDLLVRVRLGNPP